MTGIPEIELEIQRRLTKAYINTMPVQLTLIPRVKIRTPSGGTIYQKQAARQPQIMRFIEYTTHFGEGPEPSPGVDGQQRYSQYELQAEWNAQLEVYDIFEYENDKWEVVELYYNNGWEKRARVARFGGDS